MGEMKAGYKQTDIGVIPEDWDVDEIKNVCQITTGDKNTQDRIDSGKYPFFVRSQQVERINSYSFDGEAVLTADDGVGTGKIFHYINGKFDFHQRVYKMSNFSKHLDGFYFFQYFSNNFYARIMSMTAKSSVDSVRMEMIANMQIPLPKPEEQKAIAAALSDVDGLIESLEQLIAKKRNMKTATMQQLLSGKKRLPGFEGEWQEKIVDDFGEIITGSTPSTKISEYWNGEIPEITPTDIDQKRDIEISERQISKLGLSVSRKLPTGSVLVTCIASIGENVILRKEGACNQQINAIIPNKNYCPEFIYYLMEINKNFLLSNAGITATRIISKREFSEIIFMVPKFEEQTAIAAILSDMDTEIESLQQRLEKTRSLKIGMMQELLTGKTRLIKT